MSVRKNWVDYAKAIGIILVVYGHVARGVFNANITMDKNLFTLIDSIIYSFHMPLFFFLSGIFLTSSLKKRDRKSLLFSKVDTIIYPYIIWSLLQGIIEAALSKFTNGSVSYSEVFTLLWSPRAQFWFLYALFMVFAFALVIIKNTEDRNRSYILLIASVGAYIFQSEMPDYLNLHFIYGNVVFFTLGIIFGDIKTNISSLRALIVSGLIAISLQYLFHAYYSYTYATGQRLIKGCFHLQCQLAVSFSLFH